MIVRYLTLGAATGVLVTSYFMYLADNMPNAIYAALVSCALLLFTTSVKA